MSGLVGCLLQFHRIWHWLCIKRRLIVVFAHLEYSKDGVILMHSVDGWNFTTMYIKPFLIWSNAILIVDPGIWCVSQLNTGVSEIRIKFVIGIVITNFLINGIFPAQSCLGWGHLYQSYQVEPSFPDILHHPINPRPAVCKSGNYNPDQSYSLMTFTGIHLYHVNMVVIYMEPQHNISRSSVRADIDLNKIPRQRLQISLHNDDNERVWLWGHFWLWVWLWGWPLIHFDNRCHLFSAWTWQLT